MTPATSNRATPGAGKKYRVNLTLPAEIAVLLSETAKNLGMSQSALIAALLSQSIGPLHRLSQQKKHVVSGDPASVRRFRGDSVDAILDALKRVFREI